MKSQEIYKNLIQAANDYPNKIAIESENNKISYRELETKAYQFANFLDTLNFTQHEMSQQKQSTAASVAIILPNCIEYVYSVYGAYMANTNVVPMNVMLTGVEILHILKTSNVHAIVTNKQNLLEVQNATEQLEHKVHIQLIDESERENFLAKYPKSYNPVELKDNSHLLTIYTSGTTGASKGVMLSNLNLQSTCEMLTGYFPLESSDRLLCVLPLFHCFALNGLLNTSIKSASTLVLDKQFELEKCMRHLQFNGITWFAAVPTIYEYLLAEFNPKRHAFPDLKISLSGGAPLHENTYNKYISIFSKPIYEAYGLTETTAGVCANHPGFNGQKSGSVGHPYHGVEIKVMSEKNQELTYGEKGELYFRSNSIMLGYQGDSVATNKVLKNGWLATGDVGYVDNDGFVTLLDRKKDIIIKGGFNIYPREVEEVIKSIPEVIDCSVIGIKDQLKGENVQAYLVTEQQSQLSAKNIEHYLKKSLAKYKWPNEYFYINGIPKSASGKILKNKLLEGAA